MRKRRRISKKPDKGNEISNMLVGDITGPDIEIACMVTNGKLTKLMKGPHLIIQQSKDCLDKIGEWCQSHQAASGLTKKLLQSTSNESNAEKQDYEFGTLNSLILLPECTLVGAESRLTSSETIDDEIVNLLESDTESKCKRITKKVCITASGSKKRNMALWDYLAEKVNEDGDVLLVLNGVNEFLRANKLVKKSSAITAFVVGYSNDLKKCISFTIGDNQDTQIVESKVEAIGGGRSSAMRVLSDCDIQDQTSVKAATKYLMKALLWATFCDPNCGGILRVWEVESHRCEEVVALHAVDALLKYYTFSDVELLCFDRGTYEEMNYYRLYRCLKSLSLSSESPIVPGCFGYIKKNWKLHLIRLHSFDEIQCFFQSTEKVGGLTGVRRIRCNEVSVYVVRASRESLHAARVGTYIDKLDKII